MWYDPVFRVETLDGRRKGSLCCYSSLKVISEYCKSNSNLFVLQRVYNHASDVWCKRHYKVNPQKVPGTFRFSVLDNGITSDEFWTIVAVADDLSWIVFHYAGAAAAVGMRYLGGLLCTADGSLPDKDKLPGVWKALHSAGIEPCTYFICPRA
jgi:hypothetical protein